MLSCCLQLFPWDITHGDTRGERNSLNPRSFFVLRFLRLPFFFRIRLLGEKRVDLFFFFFLFFFFWSDLKIQDVVVVASLMTTDLSWGFPSSPSSSPPSKLQPLPLPPSYELREEKDKKVKHLYRRCYCFLWLSIGLYRDIAQLWSLIFLFFLFKTSDVVASFHPIPSSLFFFSIYKIYLLQLLEAFWLRKSKRGKRKRESFLNRGQTSNLDLHSWSIVEFLPARLLDNDDDEDDERRRHS